MRWIAFVPFLHSMAAHAELADIWAVDDGSKIKATDVTHPLKQQNGIYVSSPKKQIRLFASRNETVAFQLILVGGMRDTQNVSIDVSQIGAIKNGPLHADPDRYYLGRYIELFRQGYLNVTTRSRDLAWAPNTPAEPRDLTGWIPDPLIPLGERETFTVPAHKNQGIWIDIYIPKTTSPGIQRGTITVLVEGTSCSNISCAIPIELEVLPWTLPDTPTTKAMVYFSCNEGDLNQLPARYVESDDPWDIDSSILPTLAARHRKLMRRHAITLIDGGEDVPNDIVKHLVKGTPFTRAAGYEGYGEDQGYDVYPLHTYGGKLTRDEAAVWTQWFSTHAPHVDYFLYVWDEPERSDFPMINRVARAAKPVKSLVTIDYRPSLDIDIYMTLPSRYSLRDRAQAQPLGKTLWIYNGVRPFSGSFVTDDVAISPRVNAWIQYKYRIPRWFYWESTYYDNEQGDAGQTDLFRNSVTFSNRHGDVMNGDGVLMYPGRDFRFKESDMGLDVPLPSIRLKNWRRGILDAEYLVLAERAGLTREVQTLLTTLIPKALSDDLSEDDEVSWPEDGESWLKARRTLVTWLRDTQPKRAIDPKQLPQRAPSTIISTHTIVKTVNTLKRWIREDPIRLVYLSIGGAAFGVFIVGVFFVWFRRSRAKRHRT